MGKGLLLGVLLPALSATVLSIGDGYTIR